MKRLPLYIALLIAASLAHGPAAAAVNLFLQLDGIKGESADEAHPGWIEISSFQFGVTNSSSIGSATGGAGKVSFSDLSITKTVDKTSPSLLLDAASGTHIKDGFLDVVRPGGGTNTRFLEYKFTDVFISSYSISSGNDLPQESLSLNFAKIQFTEFTQKADGSPGIPITIGWDVVGNKQIDAVPEPATLAMLVAGLGILAVQVGRRHRS